MCSESKRNNGAQCKLGIQGRAPSPFSTAHAPNSSGTLRGSPGALELGEWARCRPPSSSSSSPSALVSLFGGGKIPISGHRRLLLLLLGARFIKQVLPRALPCYLHPTLDVVGRFTRHDITSNGPHPHPHPHPHNPPDLPVPVPDPICRKPVESRMACEDSRHWLPVSTVPLDSFSTPPLPRDDDGSIAGLHLINLHLLPFSLLTDLSFLPILWRPELPRPLSVRGRNRQKRHLWISWLLAHPLAKMKKSTRTPGPWFISVHSRRQQGAIQLPIAPQLWHRQLLISTGEGGTGGRGVAQIAHEDRLDPHQQSEGVSSSPYPSRRCPVSKPRLRIFKLLSPPVKAGSARFGPDAATRRSGHSFKLHMHSGLTRLVLQPSTIKIQEGHGSMTGPVEPRAPTTANYCVHVHPCHSCVPPSPRGWKEGDSALRSPPSPSCSGSTACFYLSSPAGSDTSWPRYAVAQKKKAAGLPLPDKLQKPASVLGVWQAFWKPPRKDLSCTSLRRACVSMDSIGSRMPARVSRPLHHHGPRPAPMTKRNPAPFHWGSPSSPDTLTPVEASPSSLTTHNLEAPREETSLAACSRRFKFKLSRVPAPLRQSRAPPPIVTTKEMASITDIGHVHVLSPSGPRFRRVCRVVVVVMEVVQFSGTCAPPPTSKPHQCVCCVYFYHPDRLSWEPSHEEICRNNEIEPV